jgi:hypothetical protein
VVFSHYTPLPKPPQEYLTKAREAAEEIAYDGELVAPLDLDVIPL